MDQPVSPAPTRRTRSYGPEYGLEAIRRLEAGFSIVYSDNGTLIEEHPDGRRFAVRLEPDETITDLRELSPKS